MDKYFLYRHVRHDKNEPFYIGIGTFQPKGKWFRTKYKRAFDKRRKNNHWLNIINITTYDIEILFESHSFAKILEKEIEFIKLYGREDLGLGPLVNYTDGGIGTTNWNPTDEIKQKMVRNSFMKGKFGSEHHLSKKIFVYSVGGRFINSFDSYRSASKALNIDKANFRLVIDGECQQCCGMVFFNHFMGKTIDKIILINKKIKKISCFDCFGNKIETFNSITDAAKNVSSTTSNICHAAKKRSRICRGFHWAYENQLDSSTSTTPESLIIPSPNEK